ncbi:phosphatase PAP2 family protein [Luteimonas vadosa]|uniref:undecaprenyl-diphosphate phosphatase n=1 Tax=Luteimonas vadosa TaxID=1165507 RepID=A0ABP9E8A3_9GAMM
MSNASTDKPGTLPAPAEAVEAVKTEARVGNAFLRVHGRRLLLVFAGLLLPLWGYGELVDHLRDGEVFAFDQPGLEVAHAMASAGYDRLFIAMSALGYLYGVVPIDILLVLGLAIRRHFRAGVFVAASVVGSALLNLAAKHAYARVRPSLWNSIAPETTFSFPSGHAMGSMTLAAVVVLLCWWTRWRWIAIAVAAGFVVLVGLSRIYLGVHYPSDILAGWTAALVWTVANYGLVYSGGRRPWQGIDVA